MGDPGCDVVCFYPGHSLEGTRGSYHVRVEVVWRDYAQALLHSCDQP
ncbi:hypothetical protein ACPOL_6492 [Acidisarcina polymorpha]|uniref:Uncharacterized protein n=1 Tax=Acidisarcina polymorpha TaxID=2211140 RepID=A0A2Z5G9P1_9BACT|nr:hypothetical protein ACPOL_6492 [Acidisarcina polymorpha]